ncbi:MAG: Gluconokinase [uncultured Thermomicrobiales bacterium]|uniref:Gluconokinase n=1 Tax=uncultured Thermomicrobiales bacterium TaxID=1645740 RepID=A0A6J4U523_9BACT|nr:MAG: Gluconokinase [uncultured Thermomicrobiales bacterium]
MPSVARKAAAPPLVLALDLGTSSLRALAFDHHARAVAGSEEQLRHALRTTADGGAETDPDALVELLRRCVDGVLDRLGDRAAEIAAVGVACFWHSLVGVDATGDAVTPLLMWGDTRSATMAASLRAELDAEAVHQQTGCLLHSSFWPAKLRWMAETDGATFGRAVSWWSFPEYVAHRWHRAVRTTVSMASGTGLLDTRRAVWADDLLPAFGLRPDQLPPLCERDEPWTGLAPDLAGRWPSLAGVPWYPAVGDGAAANVGSGAVTPARIALTLGTSGAMRAIQPLPTDGVGIQLPPAVWAYRLDRKRIVVGGALSNGGNLMGWLRGLLGADEGDATASAAERLPPDVHGLTILPAVAGERSPSWNDHATGVIAGLTLATRAEDLLRAGMEAVAYRFALLYEALRPLLPEDHEIAANGGAILHSPAWLQIVADTLNHRIAALPAEDEATARGAAILALNALGVWPDLAPAERPDHVDVARVYEPDPGNRARYQAGLARQRRLEAALSQAVGVEDAAPTRA